MLAFVSRRLLATIPVLVMVAVVVFAILRFSPGDPAIIMAGDGATPERIVQIRQTMGLDQPVIKQFFIWGGKLLQGDLALRSCRACRSPSSSGSALNRRSAWRC